MFLTRFTKFGERGFLLESVGGEWRDGGGVPVSRLEGLCGESGGETLMGLLRFEDRGFLWGLKGGISGSAMMVHVGG